MPWRSGIVRAQARIPGLGGPKESASACAGGAPACVVRRSARPMPCCTGMASSSRAGRVGHGCTARCAPSRPSPTSSGVRTTRGSSCLPIGATATPGRSPTTRAGICSPARRSRPRRRCRRSRSLSAPSSSTAYPRRFAPTTASPRYKFVRYRELEGMNELYDLSAGSVRAAEPHRLGLVECVAPPDGR